MRVRRGRGNHCQSLGTGGEREREWEGWGQTLSDDKNGRGGVEFVWSNATVGIAILFECPGCCGIECRSSNVNVVAFELGYRIDIGRHSLKHAFEHP